MAEVPEPPTTERNGIADSLWAQIVLLKPGTAVKAEFEADTHADYVRSKLRARAKTNKQFLSSSRSLDGKTRTSGWKRPNSTSMQHTENRRRASVEAAHGRAL